MTHRKKYKYYRKRHLFLLVMAIIDAFLSIRLVKQQGASLLAGGVYLASLFFWLLSCYCWDQMDFHKRRIILDTFLEPEKPDPIK